MAVYGVSFFEDSRSRWCGEDGAVWLWLAGVVPGEDLSKADGFGFETDRGVGSRGGDYLHMRDGDDSYLIRCEGIDGSTQREVGGDQSKSRKRERWLSSLRLWIASLPRVVEIDYSFGVRGRRLLSCVRRLWEVASLSGC